MKTLSEEKEISYLSKNTYTTLNNLTESTKNIWFVCHGMGYLSRYFINYFKGLDPRTNYIIAPQAPSKYYQQPKMYVGANWLTKNNTSMGMENVVHYFDAIFETEILPASSHLIVLGYSQGVSVAMRYLAKRKIQFKQLIIHSGGIPKELNAMDFTYLSTKASVQLIYGTKDEYLNEERIREESERATAIFGERLNIIPFEGPHELHVPLIERLAY